MGRKKQKTQETEESQEQAPKQTRGRKVRAKSAEVGEKETRRSPRKQAEPKKVARKNMGKGAKNTVPTVTEHAESEDSDYQPSSVRSETEGSDHGETEESPVKEVSQSRKEGSQRKRGKKDYQPPSPDRSDTEGIDHGVKETPKKKVSQSREEATPSKRGKRDSTFAPEVEVEIAPWLQAHPHLWNTKDENYRNTAMCLQTWEEGAERFNCSGKYMLLVNLVS